MNNKKGRTAKQYSPKQDTPNHTDPLIGWHSLGKPSRSRTPKRGWKRKAPGIARCDLLALLLILVVAALLLIGGRA